MALIKTVQMTKDSCDTRFVLYNAIVQRESDALLQSRDGISYCDDEIPESDKITASLATKKTPFYHNEDELYFSMMEWYDRQEEQLVKYEVVKTNPAEEPLPLISEYDRRKRQHKLVNRSVVTPFYSKLRQDLNKIGRTVKHHDPTGLGQQLVDFCRNFYNTARSLSLGRRIWRGFIFGFSHNRFCERFGYTKTALNRILNLAAGLGLITKITPWEAKGIGEYWHKRYGVGMLQFRLDDLDLAEIERRWLLWLQSGTKLHDVTLGKIKAVLGVDIETHPEAKDKELRKIIRKANDKFAEEKEQREKERAEYNRTVHYDPFGLGHKWYHHEVTRQYTPDEARQILVDIIKNHNDRCRMKWYTNDKDPLLTDDTVVYYRARAGGRTKFQYRKYPELPKGLLISEYQYFTARNYARAVLDELYEQGLIAIMTETRNSKVSISHRFRVFLWQVQMMKGTDCPKVAATETWVIEKNSVFEEDEDLAALISSITFERPTVVPKITLGDIIRQRSRGEPNAP